MPLVAEWGLLDIRLPIPDLPDTTPRSHSLLLRVRNLMAITTMNCMGSLADEIRRRSALADEQLHLAETPLQQCRIVADLAFETAALVGLTLDGVVGRLTQVEKDIARLNKRNAKKKNKRNAKKRK